jgi:hypothetical protein
MWIENNPERITVSPRHWNILDNCIWLIGHKSDTLLHY